MADAEENAVLLPKNTGRPSPHTLTKLVKRLRALTLKLLPVEVDPAQLSEPTSRFISPLVIEAYEQAAGDFADALPFCLLRTRQLFMWEANHNPADYGENYGRAIACEVLARRVLHRVSSDRLMSIMSTRYQYLERDGDKSDKTSALELAIDTDSTVFLSSNEAQFAVNSLWRGDWIQKNNENNHIDYVPFDESRAYSIWDHLHPARLSVPRSQNFFRILIWFIFLVVYSQAVRSPIDRLDINHQDFDGWEIALYLMALSFSTEDLHKLYKTLRYFSWRAFGFWTIVSLITDALLVSAFTVRVLGIRAPDDGNSEKLHYQSFQTLSFVAPFIWMKLLTVVDGYKWVGTMQICVARMLKESGIFFALLSILGIGFAQGLYAIDAADGETEHGGLVVNALIQALLQSPNFDSPITNGSSLVLYYLWNVVTTVILLNVLISLFSSAYEDVVDNAEAQYLAFFAGKTVGMIRAPDSFVYPAPFNLIEVFFVAPFEPFLSGKAYAKLNRRIMVVIFFIPLLIVAFWETNLDPSTNKYTKDWFNSSEADDGEEDDPACQDPEVDEPGGKTISKVPFEEIVKSFPDANVSGETNILNELEAMKKKLDLLLEKLDKKE